MSDPIMATYARLPVTFTHGEGVMLFDENGKGYLDALCGVGVTNLGHAHPTVTTAITEQAARVIHCSNLYHIPPQQHLAQKLCDISGMEEVFFCNSGAESNEAAIKIARKFGHQKGIETPKIIVMENSFHGRTLATLTASGNRKIQAGFEPLVKGFIRAAFNDINAVEHVAENSKDVVAILVEPIQGEGGVNTADEGYLKALRKICDENDWLLMLDEVQTGNGRTGQYFAYQHEAILPDVVCTAKGLGNGLPIGACLAAGRAKGVLTTGNHGSTYGGNFLACSAALATVNFIIDNNICQQVSQQGDKLFSLLEQELSGLSIVKNLRHKGLMIGIELNQDCGELVGQALEQGLLINVTAGKVIRLLPPFIISDENIQTLVNILCPLIIKLDAK